MASRKLSARANAWLSVITLLVLLAVVGVVSEQFFHRRIDLTRDREFTLSPAALKTLEGLPDIVTIEVVMSKDLPSQFIQIRTRAVDLLQEFQARSNGKVHLVFEDPGENDQKRQQAASLGIQEVQLQEQSDEGMQIKKGFFGLALKYGDKKEVIPVLENLETFEYDLIVKLKKLTGTEKTIAIVEGTDPNRFTFTVPGPQPKTTNGFDENFAALKTEMEKLYKVEEPNLSSAPIGDNVDLILVAAPAHLSEIEKFHIDQYLMKGKAAIFLTPGIDVDLTGMHGAPANNGYEDLLSQYGLGVHQNTLLELRHSQMVRFGNSFFPTPYPYWINIDYNTMNGSSPVTSKLQEISLPWSSSIYVDPSMKDGADVQILASTSRDAWEETSGFFFAPRDARGYIPIAPASFPVAVLKTGKLTSLYANRMPPSDSTHPIDTTQLLREGKAKSSILLVSNALFATDFYVGYTNATANLLFVLNALDQLALDPDLINVRSRTLDETPIDDGKKSDARLPVTLINMVLAPVILLIIGIIIGIRRRKREAST